MLFFSTTPATPRSLSTHPLHISQHASQDAIYALSLTLYKPYTEQYEKGNTHVTGHPSLPRPSCSPSNAGQELIAL